MICQNEKLQWLQRHDKECGGLYGVLPLCVGMPVRATDHLDRKRGILKGTKGHVVGWSEIADETPAPEGVVCNALPAVVYVKFETATSWQIPGMPDSNVYPVGPCRRVWYLDRQRKSPKLRVWGRSWPAGHGRHNLSSSRQGSHRARSPHRNSRALTDGACGPRPPLPNVAF